MFTSSVNDVEDRLFAVLADDTWFCPCHGGASTLSKERTGGVARLRLVTLSAERHKIGNLSLLPAVKCRST